MYAFEFAKNGWKPPNKIDIYTTRPRIQKKRNIKLSENEHFTRHIKCAKIERHKPMRWIGLCVVKSVLYAYTQYHHWRVFAIFFFRYFWRLLLPLPSNGSFLSLCSVFVCGARIYILRFYLSFSSLSTINKWAVVPAKTSFFILSSFHIIFFVSVDSFFLSWHHFTVKISVMMLCVYTFFLLWVALLRILLHIDIIIAMLWCLF